MSKIFFVSSNKGRIRDRAVAIFALGYRQPSQIQELLEPYLHSSFPWERWASALALGRLNDEKALLAFLTLLQENLPSAWITCNDPEIYNDFLRRNHHRFEMIKCLGDWGNSYVVPDLHQVLNKYIEEGKQLEALLATNGLDMERESLYALEDHIAYALGQLGAWGSLRALLWSDRRQRIATVLMALGGLQIHQKVPTFRQWLFKPNFADTILDHVLLDEEQVKRILASRFGYTPDEQTFLLQQFPDDCRTRLLEPWTH